MPFQLGFRSLRRTSKTTLLDKSFRQSTAPSGLVNKRLISEKSTFWVQTRIFPPQKLPGVQKSCTKYEYASVSDVGRIFANRLATTEEL